VGSLSFKSAEDFYILGLWLADNYWRSSSVGLSSTNEILLERFRLFLRRACPDHPIKEHVYLPRQGEKRKLIAKNIYVNSRSLTRDLMNFKSNKDLKIPLKFIPAYLAGRIDGDGHLDKKHRTGIRIVYSEKYDASRDLNLLKKLDENPVSLYYYRQANVWVIYFRKHFLRRIMPEITRFSIKLRNL